MRDVTADSGVISKEIKRISRESVRSVMKIRNKMGPITLAWGTTAFTGRRDERVPFYESGGSQSSKSGVGLGFHRQTVWRSRQDTSLHQKHVICPERRP